jgi:hypothetical protein
VPVDYSLTVINNRLQQVVNAIDAGSSNGILRLLGGNTVLSSFTLTKPCGTISGGVLTFSGMSLVDQSAAASGTSNAGRIEDSAGNIVVSGLVVNGASSAVTDIFLSPNASIVAGQSVAITAATITGN